MRYLVFILTQDIAIPPAIWRMVLLLVAPFLLVGIANAINAIRYGVLNRHRTRQLARNFEAAQSTEPPVLYLRGFSSDGATFHEQNTIDVSSIDKFRILNNPVHVNEYDYDEEDSLAEIFERIGPFVGLGNALSTDQFGAARITTSDEEWKNKVSPIMDGARLIFFRITERLSRSTMWELKQLFLHHLHKTIFYLEVREAHTFDAVTKQFAEFGLELPKFDDLGELRYVYFDAEKKYHLVFRPRNTMPFKDAIHQMMAKYRISKDDSWHVVSYKLWQRVKLWRP